MKSTSQTLDDLLHECTVRIKTKEGHGTGFFVAPGLVLTCAHVIEGPYQKGGQISVQYGGQELPLQPIGKEDIFSAPYPDLALLQVDCKEHPCVLLGRDYRAFIDFYSFGYTKDHPDGESTTVECEGILVDGGTLIKLKEGQVKPGSSGSPLLNKKTGAVCGVINRTRDRSFDLGGTGVPMGTVFAKFPDLERQNLEYHRRHLRWKDLLVTEETVKTSGAVAALLYKEPGKISKPAYWVGRELLAHKVHRLLDQSHRVLLSGMGGIGKTSLAQVLVEERLQGGSKPILWMEVRGERPDLLVEALAKACGDEEIPTISNIEAKKLALKEFLTHFKPGLLVLDNVRNLSTLEDLLEAAPDNLPVLMTSRMSFDADKIIDVEQLSSVEALDLLEKASGLADLSKDKSAQTLCALFGYHPLALEIAGASLKERRLRPTALLKRLEANPIRLSSLRRGEIRPLLDDYVAELADPLQRSFFAFGKFPRNRLTPALLAVYLNTSKEDVTESLDQLVERNLVKRMQEDDVYYLHDLIFHYVQTVSKAGEHDKDHLLSTAIAYLDAYRRNYELVGFDLSNLLGIAGIAQGPVLVKLISYLTIGGFPLQEGKSYADQRGYSIGLIEQLDRAVEAARSLGKRYEATTHYLLGKRGNAAFRRGDYELASKIYEQELMLSPDDKRRAMIGSILARTLAFCGRIEESRERFEAANQLGEKSQDDELRGFVLEQESWAAWLLKDYETAMRVAEGQLVLAEAAYLQSGSKDYEALASALMTLGSAKLGLAKTQPSAVGDILVGYQRAKELVEEHGDDRLLADALINLGEYYHHVGDKDAAQANFDQALEILQALEIVKDKRDLITVMLEHGYTVPSPQGETR